MIVEDGVVTHLNIEEPRKFEVSDAATMLALLWKKKWIDCNCS